MAEILYTSDSHFSHANIIKFTKRPFSTEQEMNTKMLGELRAAEDTGAQIIHAGDLGMAVRFLYEKYGPFLRYPDRHTLVVGNHDKFSTNPESMALVRQSFGTIIGTHKTWQANSVVVEDQIGPRRVRVLVSHNPQENLPDDIDFNVYGHVHNNLDHSMDWHIQNYGRKWVEWLATSARHLNACVELTQFAPVDLLELIYTNHEFQQRLRIQLASKVA